jgi:hypothetical protein
MYFGKKVNVMDSNINNIAGKQFARDYSVQNNLSQELKEAKDKDGDKKDSAVTDSDFDEGTEDIESQDTNKQVKSSKEKSVKEKQEDAGKTSDPDNSVNSDDSDSFSGSDTTPPDEKELSVLFYLRGDCNLGEQMARFMVDLESFGSNDDINLVAQFNRRTDPRLGLPPEFVVDGDWEANRRYFITKNEDPEFDEVTVEKLLDLAAEHPGNPYFYEGIAQKYNLMGNKDKAEEYLKKYEEGLAGLSKDESKKLREENLVAIEKNFGFYMFYTHHFFGGFERHGVTEITSEVLEEFPNVQNNEYKEDLQNFLEWGVKEFPAKNHILVVAGHGMGISGLIGVTPAKMREALADGVKNANDKTGRDDSIDAVIFQSCFMGNLEAATELIDNTKVYIGSEDISYGMTGYQWDNILANVQESIDETGHFDVKQFAYDYVEHFRVDDNDLFGKKYNKGFDSVSATDMDKLPELLESFNDLLETCEKEGMGDNQLFKAVVEFQDPDTSNDFGTFIKNLKDSDDVPAAVKESADEALEIYEETIINNFHNIKIPSNHDLGINNKTGLTIWAPDNASAFYENYDDCKRFVPKFIELSNWDERLQQAADNIPEALRNETKSKIEAALSFKEEADVNIRTMEAKMEEAKKAGDDEEAKKLEADIESFRMKRIETLMEMGEEIKKLEEPTRFWKKEND